MKKILFFVSLLFAVVCYAAPPPDVVLYPVTDQCGYVVQDNQPVTVVTLNVPEVAFNYLGNFELSTCNSEYGEQVSDVVVPQATVTDINYFRLSELNKPPSLLSEGLINNRNQLSINQYKYCENKQNSNYGYPFTGDRCRIS